MEQWIVTLSLMVFSGILGATARIFVQRWSYKEWPHDKPEGFLVALALGAMGGWLSYEVELAEIQSLGRLGAFAFGYLFPDLIENLLDGWKPQ